MLIIVTGEDAQERVFGLTRRIVKRLVPGLRGIMGNETFAGLTPTMPFDPPTPEQGQAAGSTAQTNGSGAASATTTNGGATGADDSGHDPAAGLGTNPTPPQPDSHLVTRLRIVEKTKGTHVLQISDTATTLNVPLNAEQIIQFTQGILTVLGRSEWALDWNEETVDPQTPGASAATSDATAGEDELSPNTIDITADSPSRYRH